MAPVIERLLQERGIAAKRFSIESGLGDTAIRDILEGRSLNPRHDTIEKIAKGFGLSIEALIGQIGADPAGKALAPNVRPAPDAKQLGTGGLDRDVPVLGVTVGGADGDFETNGEFVDWARRPHSLAGIKTVFAIYVVGDSMYPVYRQGDLVYAQHKRMPAPGDDVVIEMKPLAGEEVRRAYLKRFVRMAGPTMIVEQFNPGLELPIPRDHIAEVSRVYRTNELYGI